jgi:two-component system cell cycle sensor histidine kinase/response regulator CckA
VADVDQAYDAVEFLHRHSGMALGAPSTVQRVHRRKDGTSFPVEILVSLFEEGQRPLFLAITRDVSEGRRLEEGLRQSQKMEALGRLAGGVAHDFNNLLTAILGYSDMLLGRVGPDLRKEVSEVKQAGERAAQLTRQLLAFSRRQVIRPRVLDLNEVARAIEGMLRRLIPEAIRVELAPGTGQLWVKADAGQIDQVILNLALNARDAMPRGGLLRISTTLTQVEPDFVDRHPGSAIGSYVVLSVSDTGVGISKETLAHLFEPFFTTKDVGKGTGLGLATVYGITKQSGGFLTVASEPGKGTTFRIYLPCVQDRPKAQSESQVVAIFSGTERILLVEDDAAVRGFVAQGLRLHGYTVSVAATPEEALRCLEPAGVSPELLLTDIVMPGMSGRDLARELRERHPGIRVVYMSGYTEDVALQEGRIEPGAGFIAKPFVMIDLLARIRKTLARMSAEGSS